VVELPAVVEIEDKLLVPVRVECVVSAPNLFPQKGWEWKI
jgi:hypothetical protein